MIKDKTQKQEGGDNSANYQAETINQYGLSYRDAKEIALDVFKENFISLSEQAKNTAKERAEELTNAFLNEIKEKNPKLLNSVQEPSMQNAIYTAQKSYAISGDKDTADILVDILVERVEQNERNLRQIVLDESLEVVPKLTVEQLDALTIIFLVKRTVTYSVINLATLKEYLETDFYPLTEKITKSSSTYEHLAYCNCVNISPISTGLQMHFLNTYKGLFCKGLSPDDFINRYGDIQSFPNMLIPCFHNTENLQVNALNDEGLLDMANKNGLSEENIKKIKEFFNSHLMKEIEVKKYLLKQGEFMDKLFDVWNKSLMGRMTLTTVGIALAQANYRRKIGKSLDLSIWIK